MAGVVAILEDDPGRINEMRLCLPDVLPGTRSVFFENADDMITWLAQHLGDVVLISLDHDLPLLDNDGRSIDCGTGRQVADFLVSKSPTCPVIVHSSNDFCAPGMFFALRDAGWPVSRVYPASELSWVRREWGGRLAQLVQTGWIAL